MNYVLDTCSYLWLVDDQGQLSPTAVRAIAHPETDLFISGYPRRVVKGANGKCRNAGAKDGCPCGPPWGSSRQAQLGRRGNNEIPTKSQYFETSVFMAASNLAFQVQIEPGVRLASGQRVVLADRRPGRRRVQLVDRDRDD